MARYGGRLPDDEETLRSFKGIGAYTAGAIRSFAFGQRAAILDTNVARVLFRVFIGEGDSRAHAMRRRLWAVSEALVPRRRVFDFNQALMDLGATVCTARKPLCLVCPMATICAAYPFNPENGSKDPTLTPVVISVVAAVIEREGRLLVTRRPAGTHLEGYWEFPGGKVAPGETHRASLARELQEELGCDCEVGDEIFTTDHAYPDRTVRLHFHRCTLAEDPRPMLGQEMRWIARADLRTLQFPPADETLIAWLVSCD